MMKKILLTTPSMHKKLQGIYDGLPEEGLTHDEMKQQTGLTIGIVPMRSYLRKHRIRFDQMLKKWRKHKKDIVS
jgi:hypothetical protein